MPGGQRFTAAQFLAAIPDSGGLFSVIAARVGCSWNTAKERCSKNPKLRAAVEQERERIDDKAVSVVIGDIDKGAVDTSKWWLARKRRGEFGDGVDVTTGGKSLDSAFDAAIRRIYGDGGAGSAD